MNVGPIFACQCSALPCWLCVQCRHIGWCERWAHRCVPVFGIAQSVVHAELVACAVLSSQLV